MMVRLTMAIGRLYILEMEGSLLKLNHLLKEFLLLSFSESKEFWINKYKYLVDKNSKFKIDMYVLLEAPYCLIHLGDLRP